MFRWLLWSAFAFSLAGCAVAPESKPAPEPAAAPESADPIFHVLAAELALKQGQTKQALKSYLSAMTVSDDPRLAERATRLALYLGDREATERAATRWLALAPTDPQPRAALGVLELRAGNLDAAVGHFQELVRVEPSGAAAGFQRLTSLLREEAKADAALAAMEALAADYPAEPAAQLQLAELALALKRPELALTAAEKAAALDPASTAPALLKVRAYLLAEQGDKAVALLENLLKRHTNDYELRLQYARALLTLERNDKALKQYELLLKQRPEDAQTLFVAALLSVEVGDHERARGYLLKLVNAGARVNEAYYYLGRLAQSEKDFKGALRWYRQVEGEYRPEAMLRIATVLAQQGEMPLARAKLNELRQDYPSLAVRSYLVEGELLRERENLAEAFEHYTAALAQHPKERDLLYARALTAALLGRVAEAEADFRAILAEQPDHAQALNALGYTLVDRTDRYQEGYELIKKAFELRPDDPAVIDSMGWAAYRLGRLQEARDYLEQAHRLSDEAEIAAHLVEVLWRLDERQAALKLLDEALKKAPTDKLLLETKKRLK